MASPKKRKEKKENLFQIKVWPDWEFPQNAVEGVHTNTFCCDETKSFFEPDRLCILEISRVDEAHNIFSFYYHQWLSSTTFKAALALYFHMIVPQIVDPLFRCDHILATAPAFSASLQRQPPAPSKPLSPAHLLLPGMDQWSVSDFLSCLASSVLTGLNRQIGSSPKQDSPTFFMHGQSTTRFFFHCFQTHLTIFMKGLMDN